jgi:hypothetical protein
MFNYYLYASRVHRFQASYVISNIQAHACSLFMICHRRLVEHFHSLSPAVSGALTKAYRRRGVPGAIVDQDAADLIVYEMAGDSK